MGRDEQIGRLLLEASTGMHGEEAKILSDAWCDMARNNEELQACITELEKDCCQLIDERDERDEVIDALMAQVLGSDCKEWSSAYGFNDAVVDVECRMKELESDAARYRWLRDDSKCSTDGIGEIYVTQHRLPFDDDSMDIDLFMDALDEAIDTTMQKD